MKRPRLTAVRAATLARQRYRCLYCQQPIGTVLRHRAQVRMIVTTLAWDRRPPDAYRRANPDRTWVAACDVCRRIKGTRTFEYLHEARALIREEWARLRIERVWTPRISSEADPQTWAASFAAYLAAEEQQS